MASLLTACPLVSVHAALTVFSPDGHVSPSLGIFFFPSVTYDLLPFVLLSSSKFVQTLLKRTLSLVVPQADPRRRLTLDQVDYALEAVAKGTAAVGVKSSSCVVLGVEKKTALQLQDPRTVRKVAMIDDHVCLAFAGTSLPPPPHPPSLPPFSPRPRADDELLSLF